MARDERDREDLLREATALVERAELSIEGRDEPIVVGFRANGAISFFLGVDPVYQFNSDGKLRRAYVGGLLYKAERGQLVALRRERTADAVVLARAELSAKETRSFIQRAGGELDHLRAKLNAKQYRLVGEVPPGGKVVMRAAAWLEQHQSLEIASLPNVR